MKIELEPPKENPMAKRGRPRKNKEPETEQGYLDPSLAPVKIKEVTAACKTYYDRMRERAELSKDEHEARESLIQVMLEHDLKTYEYLENIVELTALQKVKFRKKKEQAPDYGEE